MALQKTVTTPHGFDVSYWKVQSILLDTVNIKALFELRGWKDQAARDAGAEHMMTYHYAADDSQVTFDDKVANLQSIYNWLKTDPQSLEGVGDVYIWSDATNA